MNPETIQFFAKHLVCLWWVDRTPGERALKNGGLGEIHNVSGFIISVKDVWYWFTAGHVLDDIRKAQNNGQRLENWRLDDMAGLNATFTKEEHQIPFAFNEAEKFTYFCDDEIHVDYAFIHIRPYYRALLEKNKIEPLTEQVWKNNIPLECEGYWMLGVPNEFLIQNEETIEKGFAFIRIEKLSELPPNLKKDKYTSNLFYGQIDISPEAGESHLPLTDIRGMSGGPIFGFKKMENGQLRYWIVALQSSWFPNERIIIGSPVLYLAEWISQELYK